MEYIFIFNTNGYGLGTQDVKKELDRTNFLKGCYDGGEYKFGYQIFDSREDIQPRFFGTKPSELLIELDKRLEEQMSGVFIFKYYNLRNDKVKNTFDNIASVTLPEDITRARYYAFGLFSPSRAKDNEGKLENVMELFSNLTLNPVRENGRDTKRNLQTFLYDFALHDVGLSKKLFLEGEFSGIIAKAGSSYSESKSPDELYLACNNNNLDIHQDGDIFCAFNSWSNYTNHKTLGGNVLNIDLNSASDTISLWEKKLPFPVKMYQSGTVPSGTVFNLTDIVKGWDDAVSTNNPASKLILNAKPITGSTTITPVTTKYDDLTGYHSGYYGNGGLWNGNGYYKQSRTTGYPTTGKKVDLPKFSKTVLKIK
jgi:hypothetical protein